MSTEPQTNTQSSSFDASFVESVDTFLDELNGLSGQVETYQGFYGHLISRLEDITNSPSIAIWIPSPNHKTWITALATKKCKPVPGNSEAYPITAEVLAQLDTNSAALFIDSSSPQLVAAIMNTSGISKILSVELPDKLPSSLQRFYRELVDAIVELAEKFEQRKAIIEQDQRYANVGSFVQLVQNINKTLDLKETGLHITNDCRAFLKADRVWLFTTDGGFKLIACSGVNSVHRRSEPFRQIQKIVRESISGQNVDNENQMFTILNRPNSDQTIGVLVCEFFGPSDRMTVLPQLNQVVRPIESALNNSLSYSQLPFRRSLNALRWLLNRFGLRSLPITLLILSVFGAAIASLFLVQTEFNIAVHGELRPVNERHVFAPVDAIVDSVHVEYGDVVASLQPVVELRSHEYELQLTKLQNELSASSKELEANRLQRSQANNENSNPMLVAQLSADIEKKQLQIEHLNEQIKWVIEKQQQLVVTAPMGGQVITRDVKTTLLKRPVQQGSRLVTIADTSAEWHIIFKVDDRDFGYLLTARQESESKFWKIQYRLESQMETTYDAMLENTDPNNTIQNDRTYVKAYVPIDHSQFDELRVGQSVLGQVFCGKKSLFFVWTRDIRDFIRTNYFWF